MQVTASDGQPSAADDVHHQLATLGEYIDDSEDFVNINMDAVRNRLIKLGLAIIKALVVTTRWSVCGA